METGNQLRNGKENVGSKKNGLFYPLNKCESQDQCSSYLNLILSVVTTPTSTSEGLKSADRMLDRQVIAV